MMDEPLSAPPRPESQAATHIVHALLQFTLAVKHRKSVVMLCTIAALLLGALYYATATRYYAAESELFVIASGDDTRSTGLSEQGRDGTNLLPTFERLITSAKVVHNAIERLRQNPDLAQHLAATAREDCRTHWAPDHHAEHKLAAIAALRASPAIA